LNLSNAEEQMSYYIERQVDGSFEDVVSRVVEALAEQGFGVLTDIDIKATLAAKLGVEFRPYRILGACNPPFAYQALLAEEKVGTMLPCNVVVQETDEGISIAAVDPLASMQAIDNPALAGIAQEVRDRLRRAVEAA